MQAAVGDEKHVPARDLAVDDAADVDARLADQVAAELDDDVGHRAAARLARPTSPRRLAPIGARSRRVVAREIRDAEAAAEVQRCAPGAGASCARRTASSTPFVCASQIASARRFCDPAEDVEAFEVEPELGRSRRSTSGDVLGVDAELLRPAAHLHARGLELEIRIDAHGDARRQAECADESPRGARFRASTRR